MPINTKLYIENYLKIRDKRQKVVPFRFNGVQQRLYDTIKQIRKRNAPVRIIILKARQMGFSTFTEAIIFKDTATKPNVSSAITTHEADATNNLFDMNKRFYDNLPMELQPALKANNAKVLEFDFASGNSSIRCYTAGNGNIGRSATIKNLHASEYAFWGNNKADVLLGLLQAVPNTPESMVIIESTANGYDDFKDRWDKAVAGESDYIPFFAAWWEMPEYSMADDGKELTKEEKHLQKLYNLTKEQLTWRRWCIKNNCGGDIDKFRQEYPSCPEEAFLMSGRPVFGNQKVSERIAELEKAYKDKPYKEIQFRYEWSNADSKDKIISYEATPGDLIRVYEEPRKGVPYVIGGDTKGEGHDEYTATVIDNTTGKRVATLQMQVNTSSPYTYQVYCLGKYYNNALIGIEINFNTAPIEELQRLEYPSLYVRRRYDDFTKSTQKAFGWKTDGNTRPLIIDKEVGYVEENIDLFFDIPTLRQMLSFVYDKDNRPDALPGKHDDILFSDMIAAEIRPQQSFEAETEEEKATVMWRESQIEDYWNADEEDRELMLKKWGKPSNL